MFLLRKQQLHPLTLKLSVAILLSFLASSPEPAAAAILRVVADPVSASSVGIGYGGLSQADGLGLAPGTGGGESVKGRSVLFAWELPASSPGDRSQAPLSLESLLTSLSQLRVDGNGKQKGGTPQVPIFNQVDFANIYEGVYIFTPKTSSKTDSTAKSADTQDKSTTAPTTNPSGLPSVVSLPQPGGLPTLSLPGGGYSLPRTSASAPLSVVSLPQTAGLSVPSLPGGGYSIPIDPQKELSSMPTDGTGKLNDFLKVLGQFGALSVDVNLPLQPKVAIVNALNLKTDYSLPSNLQGAGRGKTLAAASQIQQQVQQQVERNSQQYQQQQAQIQQQIQRQMQEEQRRQEQFQREQQRRFQEQERQLRQQYQQQQQEIERQMQQQIQQQQQRLR